MSDPQLARAAVDRAVLRQTCTDPLTLGACAVGVGAGALALALGGALAWGVAAVSLVTGGGAFCVNHFLRRARYVRRHVEAIAARRERERLQSLGRLRATLFDLAEVDGPAASLAAQGLEQYQALRAQHEAFPALLERKLNVGELTWLRYVGAVDAAYEAVVANLSGIVDRLGIVSRAASSQRPDDHAAVEALLAENANALAALADVASAIAGMRDLDADPERELEPVIGDLEHLARRARRGGD